MRSMGPWISALAFVVASGSACAQGSGCEVKRQPYVEDGVAQGQMRVLNDGSGCGFTFKFGGNIDPSSWRIVEAPRHGRLQLSGSSLKYFPESGYAGPDAFVVAVFGTIPHGYQGNRSRNGRFAFEVDVRASSSGLR
jgi:hypothetical protein